MDGAISSRTWVSGECKDTNAPVPSKKILVNFNRYQGGQVSNPDHNGNYWNNTTQNPADTGSFVTVANLVDSGNTTTGIGLAFTDDFTERRLNYFDLDINSWFAGFVPGDVFEGVYFTDSSDTSQPPEVFKLTGLDQSKTYTFKGIHNIEPVTFSTYDRKVKITETVNAVTSNIVDADENISVYTLLENLIPNASGELIFEADYGETTGQRILTMEGFIIEEYSPPPGAIYGDSPTSTSTTASLKARGELSASVTTSSTLEGSMFSQIIGAISTGSTTTGSLVAFPFKMYARDDAGAFTHSDGRVFQQFDYSLCNKAEGQLGDFRVDFSADPDDFLYEAELWKGNGEPIIITVPIANGTYTVRMHYCELYWQAANQRLYHVSLEGVQVETDIDIWTEAGGRYIPLIKDYEVTVTDGDLVIQLDLGSADAPKFTAVEILEVIDGAMEGDVNTTSSTSSTLTGRGELSVSVATSTVLSGDISSRKIRGEITTSSTVGGTLTSNNTDYFDAHFVDPATDTRDGLLSREHTNYSKDQTSWTIEAVPKNHSETVDSVSFSLSGAATLSRSEGFSPYSLFGDNSGDFIASGAGYPYGDYTLEVTTKNAVGTVLYTRVYSFTIINPTTVNNISSGIQTSSVTSGVLNTDVVRGNIDTSSTSSATLSAKGELAAISSTSSVTYGELTIESTLLADITTSSSLNGELKGFFGLEVSVTTSTLVNGSLRDSESEPVVSSLQLSLSGDTLVVSYNVDSAENNRPPEVLDIVMSGTDQAGQTKTITVTWIKNSVGAVDNPQLTPYTYTNKQGGGETALTSISADSHTESEGVVTSTYTFTFGATHVGLYMTFSFVPKVSNVEARNTTGLAETGFYTELISS